MQVSSDLQRSITTSQRKVIFVPSWVKGGDLLSRSDEEVTLKTVNDSLERCEFEEQISFKNLDVSAYDSNDDSFHMKDVRESLPKLIIRAPEKLHDETLGAFNIYRRGHEGIKAWGMMERLQRNEENLKNEKEIDEDLSFCSLDTSSNRLSLDSLPKNIFDPNIHTIPYSNAAELIHVEPLRPPNKSSSSIQSVKSSSHQPVTIKKNFEMENELKVCTGSRAVVKLVFPSPTKFGAGVAATFSKFNSRLMKDLSSLRMSSTIQTSNLSHIPETDSRDKLPQNSKKVCQVTSSSHPGRLKAKKAARVFHSSENILNGNSKSRICKRPPSCSRSSSSHEKKTCVDGINSVDNKTKNRSNTLLVVNGNVNKRNPLSEICPGNFED